jgi:hypothetical protein
MTGLDQAVRSDWMDTRDTLQLYAQVIGVPVSWPSKGTIQRVRLLDPGV